MARAYVFLASGITALFLNVATAILMFILAGSIVHPHRQPLALIAVSGVIELLASFTWALLIWRQYTRNIRFELRIRWEIGRRDFLAYIVGGVIPSIIAAILTGTALGWSEGKLPESQVEVVGQSVQGWLTVIFVVWGVSLGLQVVHVVAVGWFPKYHSNPSSRPRFSIDEGAQAISDVTRPASAMTQQSNPFQEAIVSSPPTLVPSEGPSSFRSSFSTLHQPLSRPGSMKKSVLVRSHSYTRPSQRSSFETPTGRSSQDEGFDSWDTSQVSLQIRETILQSKPSIRKKNTALATIPGSRSPSPAKALEGPFFSPSPGESPPQSPLPQPTISRQNSPVASPSDLPNFTSVFPSAGYTRPATSHSASTRELPKLQTAIPPAPPNHTGTPISSPVLPIQRNSSITNIIINNSVPPTPADEEHIHPLFRTTSPSPAPSPSLGTVVTAAPEAGQFVDELGLRRIRSGSLPCIASSLTRTRSESDILTRASTMVYTSSTTPPPIPRRSLSRPSPGKSAHQRKRSASFESGLAGLGRV